MCSSSIKTILSTGVQEGHWGVMEQLHFRLVFLLSCSDICYSIAMLMGDPDDGSGACYFQAVWSSFFEIASLGWVMAIATTLWGSFVRNWPQDPQFEQTLLIRYSIVVFACSFTVTLLPLADGNHYGQSGSWCWIDDTVRSTAAVLLLAQCCCWNDTCVL